MHSNGGGYYIQIPKKHWKRLTRLYQPPIALKIGDAKRMQAIALRQRDLLLNKSNSSSGNESEFYVFRYLASEGFLPGYNFTRLPVRTFVGNKSAEQGEYVLSATFLSPLKNLVPTTLFIMTGVNIKSLKCSSTKMGNRCIP